MVKKKNRIFLAIDVGTTAVRVSALNEEYEVLSCKKMEYQLATNGRWVTLNPEIYWNYTKEGIQKVLLNCDRTRIVGISVTTQGETLIPVDENGKALYDAVVWLDGRAEKQAEKIADVISQEAFYKRTGVVGCNELTPISKLLWFKEEEQAVYGKAKYFLLLEDYIIFRLSRKIVTEKSLLSTTGYFDIMEDRLWTELLEKLGLDAEKIPPVLDCGEIVGSVSKEVSAMGLPKETLVVTGAMDQVCGAIGAGNYIPGNLTETTGTALCIGKTIEKACMECTDGVPVYRHYRKDLQLLLPVCMTAGMALKWFKDNFCAEEILKAEQTGRDVYDLLNDLAESAKTLAGGVVMLPYLNGSLQPYQAPEFKGGFLGVGLHSTKADFVRALMEGVAFMLKENLVLLEQTGTGSSCLISMGGGAKSDIWCQIKADITGMEIHTLKDNETASIGAAMLCKMALDGEKELPVSGQQNSMKAIYRPRPELVSVYEEGYEKYSRYLEQLMKKK